MAAKVRDYAKLAKDIVEEIGEENIVNAQHCATRLRLVLKQSPSAETTKKISSMPAVIQVVEKGGQYQIVIGTHAKDVYAELTQIISLDESVQAEVKQSLGNRIIATMSAVFAPFVYVLAAAGLIQGVLIIITTLNPAFAETGTYSVMSFISWTPFTFLPALIAVTASKHFKCNTFVALWCCLALVNTSWTEMANQIAEGETIKFIIFNLSQTTYTSTVLPPLFLVLVLSYLEHFLEKHIPDLIKALVVPMICAAIMVPLTILVIGPLSDMLANGIAYGYNFLVNTVPVLAALVVGGIWQVFVIFGVHWGVTPMVMANFANDGCDTFQAFQTCAVVAQAAACFGVVLKSRKKDIKNVAFSAGLTGIFGITEPAIYGVTLRLKRPFVCGCIGGAIGAVVVALMGSKYYVYAGLPGMLTVVNAISPENPGSFTGELIAIAVTIVVTIILVQIIGCDEKEPVPADGPAEAETNAPASAAVPEVSVVKPAEIISAPIAGEVKALSECADPVFSSGAMGDGVIIEPTEGKVYAPCDGEITTLFDTLHAIGITTAGGAELLIHVGMDTVSLNGEGFQAHIKTGDHVKKGDLLTEFDIPFIQSKGLPVTTPVLVTNADDYKPLHPELGEKAQGAAIFTLEK